MWEILREANEWVEAMKQSIPSDREQLIALVDQNLILKMRIQGMPWYRDFLLGKLQVEDIKKNITDAILLEEALKDDPNILIRIQNRDIWWQYLSGAVPPNNLIYGELPAMLSVDRFAQENPAIYAQIQKNPMFSAWNNGEQILFSEQKNTIEAMMAQQKFVQENQSIREKFAQYWYTADAIYTSDWRSGQETGFFAINGAIYALENPKNFDPVVWKQFQESDTGARYRAWTIDPREAYRYINDLMIKIYP
jgi:hypothetical protein